MQRTPTTSIDAYIALQPAAHRATLEELRQLIRKAAPQAEETISYYIPAFRYKGMLVYFALAKKHIGFYPMPSAIAAFKKELGPFATSRGAVQLPLDAPLPAKLLRQMVKFRLAENIALEKQKAANKKMTGRN